MLIYLNGQFLPREQATISVDDRGFLFGDSLYEVIRSYRGFLFEKDAHLRRLQNGLQALRIEVSPFERLADIAMQLLRENKLAEAEATVYFQITRGPAQPRKHAFPSSPVPPTIYVAANPLQPNLAWAERGLAAITMPDLRWGRCDLKTTNLLPNVLANQQAHETGADEAIFVRDGIIVEGSHSNVFAVLDGVVTTHPLTPILLPGITRQVVLDLCRTLGLPYQESPFTLSELKKAGEVFITFTSGEVTPVVSIDQSEAWNGRPGVITRRLQEAFREYVQATKSSS
ncbi:MAG: D-amino acid aminotransferase [bacterium]